MAIDGGSYPPKLRIVDGASSFTVGVNDDTCAKTDHACGGDVIYRHDFDPLFDAVEAMLDAGEQ